MYFEGRRTKRGRDGSRFHKLAAYDSPEVTDRCANCFCNWYHWFSFVNGIVNIYSDLRTLAKGFRIHAIWWIKCLPLRQLAARQNNTSLQWSKMGFNFYLGLLCLKSSYLTKTLQTSTNWGESLFQSLQADGFRFWRVKSARDYTPSAKAFNLIFHEYFLPL